MKKIYALLLLLSSTCLLVGCHQSTTEDNPSDTTDDTEDIPEDIDDPTVRYIEDDDFGTIRLSNLSIPEGVNVQTATYTYSGKVLLTISNGLAIMDDDGTNYRVIWQGTLPRISGSNGARYLPFQDNTRILLGDFILECYPSIDECESTELVRIEYPESIIDDGRTMLHYSECIISPDNVHMAFTVIRDTFWSANVIGALVRGENTYTLDNVKVISTLRQFTTDPNNSEYSLVNTLLGGEVKQFTNGGAAISTAGAYDYGTARPMIQSLVEEKITPLSNAMGYEETGMLSPDGSSSIIMSTRGSMSSNFAFMDLMPTPHDIYASMEIMLYIYNYSVTHVRTGAVEGNIGPVLVDVEQSISDPTYEGIQLNDPEGTWVYLSPISWNDDSTKGMWLERSLDDWSTRFRIVELLDKEPAQPEDVYDLNLNNIPYAKELTDLSQFIEVPQTVKIAGQDSGYLLYTDNVTSKTLEYVNYSDDGLTFYNGTEEVYSTDNYLVYKANVTTIGEHPGVKDIQLTFNTQGILMFALDDDNLPMSRGYCQYNDETLFVSDLS